MKSMYVKFLSGQIFGLKSVEYAKNKGKYDT